MRYDHARELHQRDHERDREPDHEQGSLARYRIMPVGAEGGERLARLQSESDGPVAQQALLGRHAGRMHFCTHHKAGGTTAHWSAANVTRLGNRIAMHAAAVPLRYRE